MPKIHVWYLWTTSMGSRVDILIERRPWPCLQNGSKCYDEQIFRRKHGEARHGEWMRRTGAHHAKAAKGSREPCLSPIPALAEFQKRAYCSCPISWDTPLCTCLIFGKKTCKALAISYTWFDHVWSKGSLFAAVLLTNFAPLSSCSLTRPAFPLGFLVVSSSTVSQSILEQATSALICA